MILKIKNMFISISKITFEIIIFLFVILIIITWELPKKALKEVSKMVSNVLAKPGVAPVVASCILSTSIYFITADYNSTMLDRDNEQKTEQFNLAKLQSISNIIPNIASPDPKTRQIAILSLSLYKDDEDVINLLIASLGDEEAIVRESSIETLILIGDKTIEPLKKVANNDTNPLTQRCAALKSLALLKDPSIIEYVRTEINNPQNDIIYLENLIDTLVIIKDPASFGILLERLYQYNWVNVELSKKISLCLKETSYVLNRNLSKNELDRLYYLLDNSNSEIKKNLIPILIKYDKVTLIGKLNQYANSTDTSINTYAANYLRWLDLNPNSMDNIDPNQLIDDSPPELIITPSSGKIAPGAEIIIQAKDPSGINHIGYVWDEGKETTPIYADKAIIKAPTSPGTHTLKIYAKDSTTDYHYTGWKLYYLDVKANY